VVDLRQGHKDDTATSKAPVLRDRQCHNWLRTLDLQLTAPPYTTQAAPCEDYKSKELSMYKRGHLDSGGVQQPRDCGTLFGGAPLLENNKAAEWRPISHSETT
jgi:hypothetical protein